MKPAASFIAAEMLQRLAKSEEENLANSYFKQFNKNNLVNKYKADMHRKIGMLLYYMFH